MTLLNQTASDTSLSPAPRLSRVSSYRRASPGEAIDLYLDGNEAGPDDISWAPDMTRLASLPLNRYPDNSAFESKLAERFQVASDRVIVTAGADDGIDRLCRATLSADRELLTHTPSFEMVPRYVSLADATLVALPWLQGDLPVDAIVSRATPATAVVLIVSPNNPTGATVSAEAVRRIHDAIPGAWIVVDGAYLEFADDDITQDVLSLPRGVLLRTFSKAWGLAGLRTGYAIGPSRLIEWMRASAGPYPVSRVSLALAEMALAEAASSVDEFVTAIRTNREKLSTHMDSLGMDPLPSQGNFVLTRTRAAGEVVRGMAAAGIAIRGFAGREEIADCIRITVPGQAADLQRVCAALTQVIEGVSS